MTDNDAFISYAREDIFQADRLRSELKAFGLSIFQDHVTIEPGEPFRRVITEGINKTNCLICLISKHSATSDEVLRELELANAFDTPIIPVILDPEVLDIPSRAVDFIADIQHIYVDAIDGVGTDFSAVIRAVRRRARPTSPVIAFSNLKGGVGKTTLAAHLSSCIGQIDKLSVLMIDLDPQANLSQFVLSQAQLFDLIDRDVSVLSLFERSRIHNAPSPRDSLFQINTTPIENPSIYDASNEVEFSEFAKLLNKNKKRPVYIVPGQFELVKYTLPINSYGLGYLKANFAASIEAARKEFDVIILDLNPSSSFMIECALSSATDIVCPIRPDKYSVQGLIGLKKLLGTAFGMQKQPNIWPVINGLASWDKDFLKSMSGGDAEAPPLRGRESKDTVSSIKKVLSDHGGIDNCISIPVPETSMLKAYHEAKSSGFFSLARFERSGSWGARLAERLMAIAEELCIKTKADPLHAYNSTSVVETPETDTEVSSKRS